VIATRRLRRTAFASSAALALLAGSVASAAAQWSTVYEQFYFPAGHNWAFRNHYAAADRLFNAFDYGHAILYETLYTRATAPASLLENTIFDRLTGRILVNPPRLPLEESAIEIEYARLVPEAKAMFDWAHILHRQVYDVWADERIPDSARDAHVAELLRFYRSRADLAFSTRPKNMELMEGQFYSTAFRERYPKFNGLIWAYHWLQVGLYEPLVTARSTDERKTGVNAAVARFWQMLESAPANMPRIMPMTAAVAPAFAARYPEIAIIFDNLHSMHDVVSDILASPAVPRNRKRSEILRAAERYRDDRTFLMAVDEWRSMSVAMGVHNMGGPAVGFLADLPEGTVARGQVMADVHAAHRAPPVADSAAAMLQRTAAQTDTALVTGTLTLLMRLLQHPVVGELIVADSTLHRTVLELIERLPAQHRAHLRSMLPARELLRGGGSEHNELLASVPAERVIRDPGGTRFNNTAPGRAPRGLLASARTPASNGFHRSINNGRNRCTRRPKHSTVHVTGTGPGDGPVRQSTAAVRKLRRSAANTRQPFLLHALPLPNT